MYEFVGPNGWTIGYSRLALAVVRTRDLPVFGSTVVSLTHKNEEDGD